jgi:peptide deformylase
MGAPELSVKSALINHFNHPKLNDTITDMIETMRHYQGVGLAAPQIGIMQQIIVLEVADNPRYPQAESLELDILINPTITDFSKEIELDWEGCLSLPKLRGQVARAHSITYQAMNREDNIIIKTVSGFHARIIQHEMDHLNGILYPQRLNYSNPSHLSQPIFGFEEHLT